MRKRRRTRRGVSLGTIFMLLCSIGVLAGFTALMPSFTGNQDILIDAARLAVAMDDSLSQLSASTSELIYSRIEPLQTIVPPFTSQNSSASPAIEATPVPSPTINPKRSFTLCAGGTIELNNSVRKALTVDKEVRYDFLTDHVIQAARADLSMVTLKNTISSSNALSDINMGEPLLDAINDMGFNTINLGHSTALQYGLTGLRETAAAVQSAGMTAFGAQGPMILSINGISAALLHYQQHFSASVRKQCTEEERSSVFPPIDPEKIAADISSARRSGANIIIVSLCWGKEGEHEPTDEQLVQAQAIADAGADIILGTGNGALQPVQVLTADRNDGRYHPVLCAYSLGNLFSPDRESRVTLTSILLKTKVIYDTASQTVAFEDLTYTPVYAWRGKDEGKTIQRILINDPDHLPDFVDESQQGVMERCMTLLTSIMDDTAIPMAY